MIFDVKIRGNDGKYASPIPSDIAYAAFSHVYDFASGGRGWDWIRDRFASWCLQKAQMHSMNAAAADLWIARYQAIRGIR